MWSFETGVPKQRNLAHLLKPFFITLLQNSEEQVVQNPRDVVPCELWSCKWSLGALITSLSKHPHLHLPLGLLLTPAHVEDDQDSARGPTSRAGRTVEPGKGLLLVLCPSWLQNIGKKLLVWCEGPFVPRFHLLNQLLEHMLPLSYVVFCHGCRAVPRLGQGLLDPDRPEIKVGAVSVCLGD